MEKRSLFLYIVRKKNMSIVAVLPDNVTIRVDKADLFSWHANGEREEMFYHDIITLNAGKANLGSEGFPPELPEQLQALFCEESGLIKLPKLPRNLRTLVCHNNRLQHLPDMSNCVQLEEISASRNHLMTFPRYLPPSVITVDVSINSLTTIPDEVTFGGHMSRLDLSSNYLVKIPASFINIPATCHVRLEGNRFRQLVWRQEQLSEQELRVALLFGFMQLRRANGSLAVLRGTRVVEDDGFGGRGRGRGDPTLKNVYTNGQSVHTSSIQKSTNSSVSVILGYPSSGLSRMRLSEEVRRGLGLSTAYHAWFVENSVHSTHGITLYTLLSHVWAIITSHKEKAELCKILKDEMQAGHGVCFTGRFTRVVNSLCGFVPGVSVGISIKEQFQTQLIQLIDNHREKYGEKDYVAPALAATRELLDEFDIKDETERGAWLDAVESL